MDPLLLTVMLRQQWKSDSIVQTDCCDSVGSVADFLGIKPADAFARYVNAGGGAYFGFDVTMYRQAMQTGMASGAIDNATVRARGARVLLTEMRLGMFDSHRPDFPFSNTSCVAPTCPSLVVRKGAGCVCVRSSHVSLKDSVEQLHPRKNEKATCVAMSIHLSIT